MENRNDDGQVGNLDEATFLASRSEIDESTFVVDGSSELDESTVSGASNPTENTDTNGNSVGYSSDSNGISSTFTDPSANSAPAPLPNAQVSLPQVEEVDAVLNIETYVDPEEANRDKRERKLVREEDEEISRTLNGPCVPVAPTSSRMYNESQLMKINERRKRQQGLVVISVAVLGALAIGATLAFLLVSN
jgi:hypothetical protein